MDVDLKWFLCHFFIWWIAITIATDAEAWRDGSWKKILYGE
jgi:hypothetical protein